MLTTDYVYTGLLDGYYAGLVENLEDFSTDDVDDGFLRICVGYLVEVGVGVIIEFDITIITLYT